MDSKQLLEYWNKTAAQAGIPEDAVKSVGGILSNPSVAGSLQQVFVPRPEVDRTLNEKEELLKTVKTQLEERNAQNRQWAVGFGNVRKELDKERANKAQIEEELNRRKAVAAAYESAYGPLSDADERRIMTTPSDQSAQYLTREEWEKENKARLDARDTQMLNLMTDLSASQFDYYNRTGEHLNVREFRDHAEKFFAAEQERAASQGRQPRATVQDALNDYAGEKFREVEQKQQEERINAEVEKRLEEKLKAQAAQALPTAAGFNPDVAAPDILGLRSNGEKPTRGELVSDFVATYRGENDSA